MRNLARVFASALLFCSGCDDLSGREPCESSQTDVSVNERLDALDGETASERFERARKTWQCSVTWVELPTAIGSSQPPAGSSALELVLERTSERATFREYAQSLRESYESPNCRTPAVFVPCSLGLTSEDGALDERFECELGLQGENTFVNLRLADYEFSGTHRVTFVDDIPMDHIELNLAFTPGPDPTRIDGTLVEAGTRAGPGRDPFATTALFECTAL